MDPSDPMSACKQSYSLTVAGLGNIGSQAAPVAARIPEVARLILVDPDVYEVKNLSTQGIGREALNRPKVEVIAEQVRSIRPDLDVRIFAQRVESVPWGLLRADIFLGCLDTKAARRELNRIARRLGAGYIDAGVAAESRLVRVGVFPAGVDVCMECGWGRADYANLEVPHACQGGEIRGHATNAPAHLGQLAAAMQVQECHRMMLGRDQGEDAGQAFEILLNGTDRKLFHSLFRRNAACRFPHGRANIELIRARPGEVRVADFLGGGAALEVEGDTFVRDLICPSCQARRPVMVRRRAVRGERPVCETCGERLQELGFTMREAVAATDLEGMAHELSFAEAGFLPGDMFRIVLRERLTAAPTDGYFEFEAEPQP